MVQRVQPHVGGVGDARLAVYLDEEWFLVLKGSESWRSPPFFYPVKGMLGYTDTFFNYQIFYAPFRALGADPFLAYQLTTIVMSLVAFCCFVALVRMLIRAPLFIAIVGALVFTFANNIALHAGSAQIFGIYWVPPIALLGPLVVAGSLDRPLVSATRRRGDRRAVSSVLVFDVLHRMVDGAGRRDRRRLRRSVHPKDAVAVPVSRRSGPDGGYSSPVRSVPASASFPSPSPTSRSSSSSGPATTPE